MKRISRLTGCVLLVVGLCGSAAAVEPQWMARISTPMLVSLSGGLRFGAIENPDLRPLLEVEVGLGGGQVAVGLAPSAARNFGLGLKGAYFRSWGVETQVDRGQDFLGVVGEWNIQRVVLQLGGYRRVSGGPDDWLFNAGLGFRF